MFHKFWCLHECRTVRDKFGLNWSKCWFGRTMAKPVSAQLWAHARKHIWNTSYDWLDVSLIQELLGTRLGSMGPQKKENKLSSLVTDLRNRSQTIQGRHRWNGGRRGPRWSSAEHNWFGRTQLGPYAGSTTSDRKLPTLGGNPHRAAFKSVEQVVRLKHTCSAELGPQRTDLSFLLQVPPSSLSTINRCVGPRDKHTSEEKLQSEALQE
jgi:hypothetical protein